jgi:hypothetical protein
MAHVVSSLPGAAAERVARSLRDLARLRLITGIVLILVSLVGLLGADWDIQWHAVVGRDRTFTPPHDMILIGIGLAGIVALVSILIETRWAGRNHDLRQYGTDFLGELHSSLGSYLVGFGAVCSAVAFPLDTYWHSLYGVDVSLWAPFHTMIYMGGVLSEFGLAYMFLSAAHLAREQHDRKTTIFSYAGLVLTLGILLSKFSTFLTPAITGHTLNLTFVTVSLFPFLMALTAVFVFVLAVRLLPWTGAATMVVLVFLLLWLLVRAFVPPMMTLLVQIEHQTYLARASRIGSNIVSLLGQTPVVLLLSLSIDGVVWLGRRGRWTLSALKKWVLAASMVSMFFVAGLTLLLTVLSLRTGQGGGAGGVGGHAALAFLLALILTVPGCLIGGWLSLLISDTLQMLRR